MSGILVSYKTLDLGSNPGNMRYPNLEDIPSLLRAHDGKAFTTVHFNTKRLETLPSDVCSVFNLGDIYDKELCRGLQLNVVWPPREDISEIKSNYPDMKVILQLSSKATDGMSQDEIASRTAAYTNVDYVLIDPSGGKGLGFDTEYSSNLYKKLKESGVRATVGFAGGLYGDNVASVTRDMRGRLNSVDFSLDAEGNLRDKITPAYGDDIMNLEKVRSYISEAAKGFS